MLAMIEAAGFVDVERRLLSVGIAQLLTGARGRRDRRSSPAPARLDAPVDLLADRRPPTGRLFERDRVGVAGRGAALRVDWPAGDPPAAPRLRRAALAAIESDDEVGLPGCGPVAFGALPFEPGAGATLTVSRA